MKGIEGKRYSTAKLLCPIVEPGGMIVGSGTTLSLNTSNNPIKEKKVEITTTEIDTILKNFFLRKS